ncbi:trichome birefringence-like protein [Actinidia rufa]|uniref:Trichome birefringence-like protein n=1 Tax=Actinidia rufa TaxID=165716 RepID=A0A7J0HDQ3_9ERIC|nr:trichome birefringence-like protein [Actinidia rufa]
MGVLFLKKKGLKKKTQFVNGSDMGKTAKISHSEGESGVLWKTQFGNSSENVKNGNFSAGDVRKSVNESSVNKPVGSTGKSNNGKIKVTENHNGGNSSHNRDNVGCLGKEEWCSDVKNQRISSEKNNVAVASNHSQSMEGHNGSFGKCDLFDGRWVRDDSKPYYPPVSCPFIDRDFDCHRNGRPDDGFLRWKWQPYGCDIPSLNATDFLERLRGKKLVFVGDSLNRNMWESLVCVLRHIVRNKKRVYEISGRTKLQKEGFLCIPIRGKLSKLHLTLDYNCSVDFVGTPFLVRQSSFKGRNGSFETLRLDVMDQTTLMYRDADVVVFNTGHWWTHEKTSKGEDYYQEGNRVHPRLKVLEAYKRALTTWAKWVDKNIDGSRTQVIFRGYSGYPFQDKEHLTGPPSQITRMRLMHSLDFAEQTSTLAHSSLEFAMTCSVPMALWSDSPLEYVQPKHLQWPPDALTLVYVMNFVLLVAGISRWLNFRGGQWNSGGQCHKETEPIVNETYLANYPSKMRALEHVLQQMKTPVIYLNISRLTDYRKDGHPSIYRKEYKTRKEQIAAEHSQDCSHWCLPGVPDTWNQLLSTLLSYKLAKGHGEGERKFIITAL